MSISSISAVGSQAIQAQDLSTSLNRSNVNQTGIQQPKIAVSSASNTEKTTFSAAKENYKTSNLLNSEEKTDPKELAQATEALKKAIEPLTNSLQFSVDEDSGRAIVKIVDSKTNEVIRQLPSKEMLEIAKSLDRIQGLLFKGQA
jgi:flagellar protein FlaG